MNTLLRPMANLRLSCGHQQVRQRVACRAPDLHTQSRNELLTAFPQAGSQPQRQTRPQVIVAKYKMKTRKAAAKRFRTTGSGKVKRRHCGKQHINEKKSPKRLHDLGKPALVNKADMDNVAKCLPYAKIK
ncbi:hypothetical protein WJX73_004549 [Symbiochloris irregularis]|uniref:50S ribosomal protein L35 n=1 Tax=Symbiochloris irregularis TaxID=706552 RepID=A0AAW1PBJ5_9CHLO